LQLFYEIFKEKISLILLVLVCGAALAFVLTPLIRHQNISFEGLTKDHPLIVDRENREIRVLALFTPENFVKGNLPRYHAMVYRQGGASSDALLKSFADDVTIYDALVKIGAVPGNNLTVDTWEARYHESNPAPDMRIKGTPVEVLIYWEGLENPIPIDKIFNDPGGRGLDFRFGGNKSFIPLWNSGCILCLYSCPGSKVGNHEYTVRDYVKNTTSFSLKYERLPPKKDIPVIVIFRI
jgi:hypothetical protein